MAGVETNWIFAYHIVAEDLKGNVCLYKYRYAMLKDFIRLFHQTSPSVLFTRQMNFSLYIHSADSSNDLPELRTTQTPASELYALVVTEWPPACFA